MKYVTMFLLLCLLPCCFCFRKIRETLTQEQALTNTNSVTEENNKFPTG